MGATLLGVRSPAQHTNRLSSRSSTLVEPFSTKQYFVSFEARRVISTGCRLRFSSLPRYAQLVSELPQLDHIVLTQILLSRRETGTPLAGLRCDSNLSRDSLGPQTLWSTLGFVSHAMGMTASLLHKSNRIVKYPYIKYSGTQISCWTDRLFNLHSRSYSCNL